jgi:putative Mg2+ transporter-C (MgtC) family protein
MEIDLFAEILLKVIISIFVGSIIGIEREFTRHPAGLKTHIMVSLGATMFMLISYFSSDTSPSGVTLNLDTTRIAAGVVTGIGFLGAGVIFKEGAGIKGLTTAASIWVTAAVGLLVGVELYEIAILVAILIAIILYMISYFERQVFKFREPEILKIVIQDHPKIQNILEKKLKEEGLKIALNKFSRSEKMISLVYFVNLTKIINKDLITRHLLKNKDIIEISWEK